MYINDLQGAKINNKPFVLFQNTRMPNACVLGSSLHEICYTWELLNSVRYKQYKLVRYLHETNVKTSPSHGGWFRTQNRVGGGSGFGLLGVRSSLLQGRRARCDYTRSHRCFVRQTVSPRRAVGVADDVLRLRGSATPREDFRAYLRGTMLCTRAITLSTRG